jgi:hypothetical protein
VQELYEIFVRAHAPLPSKRKWNRRTPAKWPEYALVFDSETSLDPSQKLTFASFRRCRLIADKYWCIEEGLFFADSLRRADSKVLQRYVNDPANVPAAERFPPQIKLKLLSQKRFVSHVLWRAVRSGDLIVGFNLPFDLSRLAVRSANARKGGWSLCLSLRRSRKTGQMEVNPERPRIVIASLNSRTAFFRLSSNRHLDEWPNEPRFLDLRTMTFALRNVSYSLATACKAFNVPGKLNYKPTGKITSKEIKYCREDVAATTRLLNAAKAEFYQHPIKLDPDQAYSPASIAKAYLDVMNIAHPKDHFKVPNKTHGISMQGYYPNYSRRRNKRAKLGDAVRLSRQARSICGCWVI